MVWPTSIFIVMVFVSGFCFFKPICFSFPSNAVLSQLCRFQPFRVGLEAVYCSYCGLGVVEAASELPFCSILVELI